MTGTTASTESRPPTTAFTPPSLRAMILSHRRISLAVLALFVLFAAVLAVEIASSGSWTVSDSTSCTSWSAANPAQQRAYGHLYFTHHGPLANGASSPASIDAAVNNGCLQAFTYDEADTVSVLQAIRGDY